MNEQDENQGRPDTDYPGTGRVIVFIHGVNFFDSTSIEKGMGKIEAAEVSTQDRLIFNWDSFVGFPLREREVDTRYVGELGAGLLRAAHLGYYGEVPFKPVQTRGRLGANVAAHTLQWWCAMSLLPAVIASALVRSLVPIFAYAGVALLLSLWLGLQSLRARPVAFLSIVRRILLLNAWPFIHLLLWPLASPIFSTALSLLLAAAAMGVTTSLFMWPSRTFRDGAHVVNIYGGGPGAIDWRWVLIACFSIVAGFLAYRLLLSLVIRYLWPLIKVLSDIFRYIGDRRYRDRIQEHLNDQIRGHLPRARQLILVGHSLGSVIAADFLLRTGKSLSRVEDITLVTLGSPLRRFFGRFFSEVFPRPTSIASALGASGARFAWINVYRPLDPIGASLRIGHLPGCYDLSTHQLMVGPRAHHSYWLDDKVITAVRSALSKGSRLREPANEAIALWPLPKGARRVTNRFCRFWRLRAMVARGIPAVVLALVLAWAFIWMVPGPYVQHAFNLQAARRLLARGDRLGATVRCHSVYIEPYKPAYVPYTSYTCECEYLYQGKLYRHASLGELANEEALFHASNRSTDEYREISNAAIVIDPKEPRHFVFVDPSMWTGYPSALITFLRLVCYPFLVVAILFLFGQAILNLSLSTFASVLGAYWATDPEDWKPRRRRKTSKSDPFRRWGELKDPLRTERGATGGKGR